MFPLLTVLRGRCAAAVAIVAVIPALLSLFVLTSIASAESDIPRSTFANVLAETGPSCRYGVAALGSQQMSWLDQFKVGWYVNFGYQRYPGAPNAEYVPVVHVQQLRNGCTRLPGYTTDPPLSDAGLGASVRGHLGALWIVGNEPDRGPNPEDTTCSHRVQDDTAPEVYARAYFDVYSYIKNVDPTARVANAGLVEITPGRLQYLDIVWNTYRALFGVDMPVDVWNMHLYVLPEALPGGQPNGIANIAVGTDPSLAIRESGDQATNCPRADVYCWAEHDDMTAFAGQIAAMRQWMKDHGQRERPLMISEYSLLYYYIIDDPTKPANCYLKDEYGNCFTPTRVTNFLSRSMDYLETAASPVLGYPRDENRLVQRWLWYSVASEGAGDVSNLTDSTATQVTLVGNAYVSRAAAAPRNVNLFPTAAFGARGALSVGGGTSNVLLTAEVRNQGTVPTGQSFVVNFYRDAGLTDLIGSTTVPAGLAGCEGARVQTQKIWAGLAPGLHSFWVKVDADNAVAETQEGDNVIEGRAFVPSSQLWLPLISRGASGR